jgi:hypothetical protein
VNVTVAVEQVIVGSPIGALLRSAAAVAALGAVNTMAGATPLVPTSGNASGITVNAGSAVSVFYTVNGTQTPPMSWQVAGSVPPGLNFSGLTGPGSVNVGSLHLQGTPTAGGSYVVTLQTFEFANEGGSGSPVYNYTITVNGGPANSPPSFSTHPASQTMTAGASVTFSSAAGGTPAPTFQWRKNNVDIGGATSSSLTINSVTEGDAGSYTVVATNSQGSATSNPATLTVSAVLSAPSFTIQPASQSVNAGGGVTFSASASGNPTPTYQWRKNGNNIGGATNSSYSIGSVSAGDAGDFTVVASNSQGSVTSNVAALTVSPSLTAPVFTQQPDSQMVVVGHSLNLSATASGNPAPSYQWRKNGVNLVGATASTYSIDHVLVGDAGSYTVVATNAQGSVLSNPSNITVQSLGGDFNADGQADLIWQNAATGERVIWLMNGTAISQVVSLGTIPLDWSIAAAADFNADGQTDLVWQNAATGERVFWLMNGTAIGQVVSLGNIPLEWSVTAAADFNADGRPDLVWQNAATGERVIWLMNGTTLGQVVSLGNIPLDWSIAGAADFNADDKADLVWQNAATGERVFWLMNGTILGRVISLGNIPLDWSIAGTGDFNADGQADLLWQNFATGERDIWLMNGTALGQVVGLGTIPLDWSIGLTRVKPKRPVASDFNADRHSDILWSNSITGERALWLMNGATVTSGAVLSTVPAEWAVSGTGDYNGDGKADILWTNTATGDRAMWLMNGTAVGSNAFLGTVAVDWVVAGSGDYNGDGKADILWSNTTTGDRSLWLMDGSTVTGGGYLATIPPDWTVAGTRDYDGDGKADILWSNTATGERALWLMNGTTITSGAVLGTVPVEWVISASADYDGDGKADILWTNTVTGDRAIWLMHGSTMAGGGYLSTIPGEWVVSASGDYDGDGKADILWSNTTTGDRSLWLMDGNAIIGGGYLSTVPIEWHVTR